MRVDCGEAELFPTDKRLDVLRLEFFDLDDPIGDLKMMSDEQAHEIFEFISKWKDKVGLIVVHRSLLCRSLETVYYRLPWLSRTLREFLSDITHP